MASLTTELSAVNLILGTVGQQPVNSLSDSRADVRIAQNILEEVSRSVQAEAWNFNTEYEVQLTRNGSNQIVLASNVMRVELNPQDLSDQRPIIRAGKLYDAYNNTYTWTVNPKATILYLLDFNDLPESAKHYIAIKAARVYQQRFLGEGELHQFSMQEEQMARANLVRHETDTGKYTIFDGTGIRGINRRRRFSR